MAKKLLISESQLLVLKNYIHESNNHEILVRRIAADLDLNYEPSKGTYKKGGEFHEQPMVLNKVNQELMTPKSLFDYMMYKYKLGATFVKQIITDWFKGNLDKTGTLSKNTPIA